MKSKEDLVVKFKTLTKSYQDQEAVALAINTEAGAKINRSTVSRMYKGEVSFNLLALVVYALERKEMNDDPEYQYKII